MMIRQVRCGCGIRDRASLPVLGRPDCGGRAKPGGKNFAPCNILRSFGAEFDVQVGLAAQLHFFIMSNLRCRA